jgi:hypothetical protein
MKYFRYIATLLFVTVTFGGYFYYLTVSGQIEQNPISNGIIAVIRPYPELKDPKELTLSCNYHGKNLMVTETLYGSLYDYYRTDPAKKSAYFHNLEKDFVFSFEKDNTMKELAVKILAVGTDNGLTSDQVLDLSACFMQNISYDNTKAAKILGPDFTKQPTNDVIPRYPYETLYDNTGICTDKTYLGAALLRELGYGTSIMTFDKQKHMSLGVSVPSGYGSFDTNYGIMELTGSGFLVGDVPELSLDAGLAINNYQTLPQGSVEQTSQSQLRLDIPSGVTDVSSGTVYSRIIERAATKQMLEELKPQLEAFQKDYQQASAVLGEAETNLAAAEADYRAQPSNVKYIRYNQVYNLYITSYNDAQTKIDKYNNTVNLYNGYVEKYKQF